MPYLNSKLSQKHKGSCKDPKAKRLYIRDYGDRGQQIFIPYGITCPSCRVIILDSEPIKSIDKAQIKPNIAINQPARIKKVKKFKQMSVKAF